MQEHNPEVVVSSYTGLSWKQWREQGIAEHIQILNVNPKYVNKCAWVCTYGCVCEYVCKWHI